MTTRYGAACLTALALAAGWWLVYLTGGTYTAATHVMYIPIVTAAIAYGPVGGVLAGLAAAALMALTPVMVAAGTPQSPMSVAFRLAFFCGVGALVGCGVARVRRKQQETLELMLQSVTALTNAVEANQEHTAGHSQRVSELSLAIGRRLGLGRHDLFLLRMGSLLHDIGKLAVPLAILDKPARLTVEEYQVVQEHPEAGARILQAFDQSRMAAVRDIVLHHHERLDGSGYPYGLRAAALSQGARIVAVADVYDALTSARPYRLPMSQADAMQVLRQEVADGRLDGQLVELLGRAVAESEGAQPCEAAETEAG